MAPLLDVPPRGRTLHRFSYWSIGLMPPFFVGAHSVRPSVNIAVNRRGGYQPPAVYQLPCMLLFSGADYLAEALEQVIEQNGSDNV